MYLWIDTCSLQGLGGGSGSTWEPHACSIVQNAVVAPNLVGTIWEFPKIRGTMLEAPIIRTIVFWGLCRGPPILGKYHLYNYR